MVSKSELIVLIDKWGKAIGSAPKLSSHHANTPLHLAFSCYVFNQKGHLLLTRRADTKATWPSVWTNSCCGHPAPGETMAQAIHRRLKLELGLAAGSLKLVLPFYYYRAEGGGVVEHEACPVYAAFTHNQPTPNPDEVGGYEWVGWSDLRNRLMTTPEQFSPWCREQVHILTETGFVPTQL